jgi:N-acetylglutamate synthase-like GNAT family acetyltransferase
MDELTIAFVSSKTESMELDHLLWEVLWKPLGLPRDVRRSLKLDGECLELVVKADRRIVGGLVANWIDDSGVEIRHIALEPEVQNQGIGRRLVTSLISTVSGQGCVRVQTIARSTSVGFFRKLGFTTSPCKPPEHSDFKKHGITFVLMERDVKQLGRGDAVKTAPPSD